MTKYDWKLENCVLSGDSSDNGREYQSATKNAAESITERHSGIYEPLNIDEPDDTDSREKLLSDILAWRGMPSEIIGMIPAWLDRQAAITAAANAKLIAEQVHTIIELQAKLNEYDETHMLLPLDIHDVPNDTSRYFELFGMPERAARTLAGICEICEYGDCVTCGVPEWMDYSHDYDALLEWLRGDA